MPHAKPCLGCGRLITTGSRCVYCQRPSARKRGYNGAWERTRKAFLATFPSCNRCDQPAVHVHHIDGAGPLGPRGFDWDNLEPLCAPCHNSHTASQR